MRSIARIGLAGLLIPALSVAAPYRPGRPPAEAGPLPSQVNAKAPDRTATADRDASQDRGGQEKAPDVVFVPTPQEVVDKMLELAGVKEGDVLYDLGCGDGRIPVTAAKRYRIKAVGFDVDPQRIRESRANVEKNAVGDRVTIRQADIFKQDLREASVITLYLLPALNVRLMPQLEKLKPGSRIISHDWDMKGAKPNKLVKLRAKSDMGLEREHKIYFWVVPWEKE